MDLKAIQQALREQEFDAWLFYDHHHRDEIAYSILGLPELHVTRRWFYLIPAEGEPVKLNHRVEPLHLTSLPGYPAPLRRGARTARKAGRNPQALQAHRHAVFAQQRHHVHLAG